MSSEDRIEELEIENQKLRDELEETRLALEWVVMNVDDGDLGDYRHRLQAVDERLRKFDE